MRYTPLLALLLIGSPAFGADEFSWLYAAWADRSTPGQFLVFHPDGTMRSHYTRCDSSGLGQFHTYKGDVFVTVEDKGRVLLAQVLRPSADKKTLTRVTPAWQKIVYERMVNNPCAQK